MRTKIRTIDTLLVLGLAATYAACQLESKGIKLPLPDRELEWKDVNFISISDSHGWLLGHQHATWPEPNYSGDYGDFASFTEHLRASARERDVDLLLVDAGDHHDGSGLVSSSPTSAVSADEVFNQIKYDIMTIGNHELYAYGAARWLYDNMERYNGRYLTSNVEIEVDKKSVPIGERFAKFTTERGSNVTAFGVIFDFKAHGPGITVQSPRDMIKEHWFLRATEEEPTYFVIAGHMPVRGNDAGFKVVIDAIREYHPTVPVFVFGGHTHVRDCVTFDDYSIGVVPGRYMETIAFTSSSLSPPRAGERIDMARRYIDANRQLYKFHSNTTDHTFDTPSGLNITTSLLKLASSLHISSPLGKAPHDLFLARYPIGHPRHVATVFGNEVMPRVLVDEGRKGEKIVISNTGTLRFDLFQGRFDRNDELTVSPFASGFLYIPLPASLAGNITHELNRAGASRLLPSSSEVKTKEEVEKNVDAVYGAWLEEQYEAYLSSSVGQGSGQVVFSDKYHGGGGKDLPTMGYVTRDLCPGRGDDIDHVPVPHHGFQPDFFSSPLPQVAPDEMIDVVICDFALIDFLSAVNRLAPNLGVKESDMMPYAEGVKVNQLWGMYAAEVW